MPPSHAAGRPRSAVPAGPGARSRATVARRSATGRRSARRSAQARAASSPGATARWRCAPRTACSWSRPSRAGAEPRAPASSARRCAAREPGGSRPAVAHGSKAIALEVGSKSPSSTEPGSTSRPCRDIVPAIDAPTSRRRPSKSCTEALLRGRVAEHARRLGRGLEPAQREEVVPVGVHGLPRVAFVADRRRQQPALRLAQRCDRIGRLATRGQSSRRKAWSAVSLNTSTMAHASSPWLSCSTVRSTPRRSTAHGTRPSSN